MGARRFVIALGVNAASAFAGRAVYVITVTQHKVTIDEFYYASSANNLADGNDFRCEPYFGVPVQKCAKHAPLPTLALAPISRLSNHSQLAMRFVVAAAGTGAVVLVGLIGRSIAGPRAGLFTAVLAAVYPNLWVSDGLLLAEAFVTLCSAAVVLFSYRLFRSPNWRNAAGAGIACGLAMLARSELVLFVPLLVLPTALTICGLARSARLRLAGIALVAAVVPALPWTVYNLTRFDKPVLLSTAEGGVLAGANCHDTYYGAHIGLWNGRCTAVVGGDDSVVAAHLRHKGLEYIRHHLARLPVVVAARVGRIWSVYRPFQMAGNENEGRPKWVSLAGWATFWPLAACAVWGGVVLRRRGVRLLPVLAPVVIVTVVAAAFYGLLRFRTPAEVSIVVLGGVGADALLVARSLRHGLLSR